MCGVPKSFSIKLGSKAGIFPVSMERKTRKKNKGVQEYEFFLGFPNPVFKGFGGHGRRNLYSPRVGDFLRSSEVCFITIHHRNNTRNRYGQQVHIQMCPYLYIFYLFLLCPWFKDFCLGLYLSNIRARQLL